MIDRVLKREDMELVILELRAVFVTLLSLEKLQLCHGKISDVEVIET